jgi:hypothetical protein
VKPREGYKQREGRDGSNEPEREVEAAEDEVEQADRKHGPDRSDLPVQEARHRDVVDRAMRQAEDDQA